MLRKDFITPIISDADKPRQKFLRRTIAAILFADPIVETELAQWIRDDCTVLFHELKRANLLIIDCLTACSFLPDFDGCALLACASNH